MPPASVRFIHPLVVKTLTRYHRLQHSLCTHKLCKHLHALRALELREHVHLLAPRLINLNLNLHPAVLPAKLPAAAPAHHSAPNTLHHHLRADALALLGQRQRRGAPRTRDATARRRTRGAVARVLPLQGHGRAGRR